jgi:long-chain acyl-CoA synthetase
VGTVLPGVEVRLAEDGEILIKGPNVMMGYYNRADLTEAVLRDGWFSTGDIGAFDEKGYLKVVDRKKEILVMSNGKNVAPQPIENALKKSKYISMAMVVGDGRNYLTALLVPNPDPLLRYARKNGLNAQDFGELLKDERIRALYREEVDRNLVDFARFQKIKDFALLSGEFTQDKNELTPTLKFKRQNIIGAYSGLIEPLYGK